MKKNINKEYANGVIKKLHHVVREAWYTFPTMTWQKESGPGPDQVIFDKGFKDLSLKRNSSLELSCLFKMPESMNGVKLNGEPILVRISSIYPISLKCNNTVVFEESGVPVAAGPILITWVSNYNCSNPPKLGLTITVPDQQPIPGVYIHCYTPSLMRRFEKLDVAWARLAWANQLAVSIDEQSCVDLAATYCEKLCDISNEDEINNICIEIEKSLIPLNNKASKMQMHLIGHSHIDLAWLWRYSDTIEVVKRDFKSILKLMDEFPELTISFSQPAAYEIIRLTEPELFKQVKAHITSGRWEATTMQWVESDLNMAAGESLVRQLVQGINYSENELDISPVVFHAPDTFGHPGNIPQLVKQAGGKFYYHHRANPGEENFYPAYWWEGDDNSKILAFSTSCYNGEITASLIVQAAIRADKYGHPCGIFFHGIGDHGGGPARHNLYYMRKLKNMSGLPTILCSREDTYCNEIIKSKVPLPTHKGESAMVFEGCYTTHSDTKKYNRTSENYMIATDTLTALAGIPHSNENKDAWRKLLLNQFHDILAGSSIADVYADQAEDYSKIISYATDATNKALYKIRKELNKKEIAVTNSLGHDRTDIACIPWNITDKEVYLRTAEGTIIPAQISEEGLLFIASVPAFSTSYYSITDLTENKLDFKNINVREAFSFANESFDIMRIPPHDEEKPYIRIETTHFIALIRRNNGIIVSLIDKRINCDIVHNIISSMPGFTPEGRVDLGLNVFQITHEAPHAMSAWQLHELDSTQSLISDATVEIIETGPVRCKLRVTHTIGKSKIEEDIIFYNELPRIDFKCKIDWQERSSATIGISGLKVAFNTSLLDSEAWFETPYSSVRRPADGHEVPALRWGDISNNERGAALINDCKYGYDAMGTRMRLTLIHNAYEPDIQSDIGQHICAWSYVPHIGNWRNANIPDKAAEFNQPFFTSIGDKNKEIEPDYSQPSIWRPFLQGETSARIVAIKPAENGKGIILRIAETHGRNTSFSLHEIPQKYTWSFCSLTEQIGNKLESQLLSLRPWEVISLFGKI